MPFFCYNKKDYCDHSENCDNCDVWVFGKGGKEVPTNADRIRAMSDELLATQLVQVFKEGIKVLTDMDMPEELLDKFWNSFLERLKQPAGDQQHKHFPNGDCK